MDNLDMINYYKKYKKQLLNTGYQHNLYIEDSHGVYVVATDQSSRESLIPIIMSSSNWLLVNYRNRADAIIVSEKILEQIKKMTTIILDPDEYDDSDDVYFAGILFGLHICVDKKFKTNEVLVFRSADIHSEPQLFQSLLFKYTVNNDENFNNCCNSTE